MNILIVKLSAIGDVIHTLPALNALRARYPQARITWLVETAAADLVIGHRALDRVIVSHRKRWMRQLKGPGWRQALNELRRFWRDLRDTDYDIVIDFQALLKSGLLVWLARGRRKVGFGRGMQHQECSYLFLNERMPPVDMEVHALTRGLMLLRAIGIEPRTVAYDIPVGDADRRRVNTLLGARAGDDPRRLVAINPVALWETKLWLDQRFAELADRLADEHGATIVFTGGPGDREVIRRIRRMMTRPAIDLSGRTSLTMLAALYQRVRLLVTTDTGPMHLAAAMGSPVVALFGPTAPWRTGPFGPGHTVIRTAPPCSPCYKRQCDAHQCRCMREITVAQVTAAVAARLGDMPADRTAENSPGKTPSERRRTRCARPDPADGRPAAEFPSRSAGVLHEDD